MNNSYEDWLLDKLILHGTSCWKSTTSEAHFVNCGLNEKHLDWASRTGEWTPSETNYEYLLWITEKGRKRLWQRK